MLDHVFTDAIGALRDALEKALLERQAFEERFQADVLLGDLTWETSYGLPGEGLPPRVRADLTLEWPTWSQAAYRSWYIEEELTELPRIDIEWLEAGDTVAQCLRKVGAGGDQGAHSWYPVCRGSLDDVVGKISVGRLLQLGVDHPGSIEPHVQSAVFVPETLTGMELLDQFRIRSTRMVLVVDVLHARDEVLVPYESIHWRRPRKSV